MSSSASSPAKRALEDFVAGRLAADRLVAAVASRFYGAAGRGEKEALRPVIELAERAAPGVVSLARRESGTGGGFEVRALERSFPEESITALRTVAQAALAASWSDAQPESPSPKAMAQAPSTSWISRVAGALRRLFSASS